MDHLSIALAAVAAVVLLSGCLIHAFITGPVTWEKAQSLASRVPRWISGLMYSFSLVPLMESAMARHGDRAYPLVRNDIDIVILPPTVVGELAGLTSDVANNILALQYDLVAAWTGLSMLKESSLHMRVTQRRITPNVTRLIPELEDEVSSAISTLLPSDKNDWVTIEPYPIFLDLAARVFSRVAVGRELCRNPQWLDFAMNFTENAFNSLVYMRFFPSWMHPILRYTLPSIQASINNIKQAEDLLVPIFRKLLQEQSEHGKRSGDESGRGEDVNAISWLAEIATGDERDPLVMTHAQILLALGSIHTSLFSELNILYDLMANPSDQSMARAEIDEVSSRGWSVDSYSELHKLDSIFKESQRMSPPFLTGLRRVMKQDHMFSTGVLARKGSYVCVGTHAVQRGADLVHPDSFDGLRSYNVRVQKGVLSSPQHQFTTTEESALGFGHGRTACPGRFLAGATLKVIFVKLLTEFDFRFPGGTLQRPPNLTVHEIVYAKPGVSIEVRKRAKVTPLF